MAKTICLSCFKELVEMENIFSCSKKHRFCAPCGKSLHLQCECYESLQLLTLKNAEEYPNGSVECLGNLLNIWQCNWSGSKSEFREHFVRCHNNIEIFAQFQVSSVPFLSDQLLSATTLVRAFNSNFIFYYHTNPTTKMIYFLIFLLDGEEQPKPESFVYELMIKSPKENHCKIKFVEKCFVLEDDIIRLRDEENCAAITFQSIQKHLHEDHIHFSFMIKKNCKEPFSSEGQADAAKKEIKPVKPGPASLYQFANKGRMRTNNKKKPQSIPDAKPPSGGGFTQKEVISVDVEVAKSRPPDYSSINKHNDNKDFTSPAHCTEALKRNDDELQQPNTMKADECYHIPNIVCQTYKTPDHKIYRQKYPASCFSKPILKK